MKDNIIIGLLKKMGEIKGMDEVKNTYDLKIKFKSLFLYNQRRVNNLEKKLKLQDKIT